MKKVALLGALLAAALFSYCQDEHQLIQSVLEQTKSSVDRKNWSGLLSGFVNGTNQDKQGTITVHPTLYFLSHVGKILNNDTATVDSAFSRQSFSRNFQFDLGLTPDSKSELQIDNTIEGFTYSIFSNKQSSDKINARFDADIKSASDQALFWSAINLKDTNPAHRDAIVAFFAGDSAGVMALFPNEVKQFIQQFHLRCLKDALISDDLVKRYTKEIQKQPIWTVSGSHNYGYLRKHTYLLSTSTTLQLYLSKKGTLVMDGSYTWGDDTTQLKGNYGRKVWSADVGPDFKLKSWFELKPAAGFTQVVSGRLYKNEHKNTPNISLTPSVKVTDKLWLPVTIKYDPVHGQLFGLLSVTYSLK